MSGWLRKLSISVRTLGIQNEIQTMTLLNVRLGCCHYNLLGRGKLYNMTVGGQGTSSRHKIMPVFLTLSLTLIGFHFMHTVTINLLKPTGYVIHQQFNIQQLYVLPTLYLCVLFLSENKQRIYVFCFYLRTNSDLCNLRHKLIGFYNRDEKCLLRGTNWVFK